jgi:hypothetical protein
VISNAKVVSETEVGFARCSTVAFVIGTTVMLRWEPIEALAASCSSNGGRIDLLCTNGFQQPDSYLERCAVACSCDKQSIDNGVLASS